VAYNMQDIYNRGKGQAPGWFNRLPVGGGMPRGGGMPQGGSPWSGALQQLQQRAPNPYLQAIMKGMSRGRNPGDMMGYPKNPLGGQHGMPGMPLGDYTQIPLSPWQGPMPGGPGWQRPPTRDPGFAMPMPGMPNSGFAQQPWGSWAQPPQPPPNTGFAQQPWGPTNLPPQQQGFAGGSQGWGNWR
jgi:hypothetical protein